MEKMNTRAELIERLEDVLAVEKIARDGYIDDINTFTNVELTSKIEEIKLDEDKHIKILEQLIDMLKN